MTTMIEATAAQVAMQDTAMNKTQNEVQEAAKPVQTKASPAKRRRYSGNDVLRLKKVLAEAKMDMDKKCLSMNNVVHILQDELEEMIKSYKCSYADLARIITMAGFTVTERTLKDYLARSRKDKKEGNSNFSELKEYILSQAGKDDGKNATNATATFSSKEDDANDEDRDKQDASDDFDLSGNDWLASAVSSAMDDIDVKLKAKQHVQDIYAARKRRKKARKAGKRK